MTLVFPTVLVFTALLGESSMAVVQVSVKAYQPFRPVEKAKQLQAQESGGAISPATSALMCRQAAAWRQLPLVPPALSLLLTSLFALFWLCGSAYCQSDSAGFRSAFCRLHT